MSLAVAELIAEVKVEGDDEAKGKLKSVSDTIDKTGGGFKDMLKNALSFATGQAIFTGAGDAVGFLKDQMVDSVKVAMQHEQVMAQTVAVLKSTHDASGLTATGVDALAQSFAKLTPFSEDTTEAGENMLLTFTNIGKNVFPLATKTVLDMSQALGQDTKSSAIQLGKALNDPITGITALQRVGVTFNQTQKDLIATYMKHGEVAKAQGVILQELQKEFGGSAEAAGHTFAGQLQILNNQFDEVKVKVGEAVIPILSDLLSAAMPLVDEFANFTVTLTSDLSPALANLGQWLETTTIPLFHFSQTIISDADQYFVSLSKTLSGPVQDGFTKTKNILHDDVVPQFTHLSSLVGVDVHSAFVELEPAVLSTAHALGDNLAVDAGIADQALQTTGNWIQTTGIPKFTDFAGTVKDKLGAAFLQLGHDAQQGTQNLGNILGGKLGNIAGGAGKINLSGLTGGLDIGSIKADLDEIAAIPKAVTDTFNSIGQAFSSFGQGAQLAWQTYLQPIFGPMGEIFGRIGKDWGQDFPIIQDDLLQFYMNSKKNLDSFMSGMLGDFNLIPTGWLDSVRKTNWQALIDNLIDQVMHKLPDIVGDILAFGDQVDNATTFVGNGVKSMLQRFLGFTQSLVTDTKMALNDLIGLLNEFISGLDSMNINIGPVHLGGNIPHIPYLASGVENFAGGLAYVHKNELLVNMPQGTNVVPSYLAGAAQQNNSGNAQSRPVYLMMDGFVVGRGIMPYITDQIRYSINVRM